MLFSPSGSPPRLSSSYTFPLFSSFPLNVSQKIKTVSSDAFDCRLNVNLNSQKKRKMAECVPWERGGDDDDNKVRTDGGGYPLPVFFFKLFFPILLFFYYFSYDRTCRRYRRRMYKRYHLYLFRMRFYRYSIYTYAVAFVTVWRHRYSNNDDDDDVVI